MLSCQFIVCISSNVIGVITYNKKSKMKVNDLHASIPLLSCTRSLSCSSPFVRISHTPRQRQVGGEKAGRKRWVPTHTKMSKEKEEGKCLAEI